jgi:hypothetical protein
MVTLATSMLLQVVLSAAPSAEAILSAVATTSAMRHTAVYSGWRKYSIYNQRFSKSATLTVRVESAPERGKQFTILDRSGSSRLIGIVEEILSTEAVASRPGQTGAHVIGPSNYRGSVLGSGSLEGHDCWILALTAKTKSKYLVNGKAWVDKTTYGIVRLEATTAASVSMWVGNPDISEDYAPVNGVWLPVHTVSKSKSILLGESGLDIRHTDYEVSRATAYPVQGLCCKHPERRPAMVDDLLTAEELRGDAEMMKGRGLQYQAPRNPEKPLMVYPALRLHRLYL